MRPSLVVSCELRGHNYRDVDVEKSRSRGIDVDVWMQQRREFDVI